MSASLPSPPRPEGWEKSGLRVVRGSGGTRRYREHHEAVCREATVQAMNALPWGSGASVLPSLYRVRRGEKKPGAAITRHIEMLCVLRDVVPEPELADFDEGVLTLAYLPLRVALDRLKASDARRALRRPTPDQSA
jgi:hypothetical protein